jgi:hypothetical protein
MRMMLLSLAFVLSGFCINAVAAPLNEVFFNRGTLGYMNDLFKNLSQAKEEQPAGCLCN